MKKIFVSLVIALAIPVSLAAQAQITTKKVKIEDFSEKVTKIVLSGNVFYDSALKDAVRNGWAISPYEFCTMDEFREMKTDPDYYFLIKVKGRFRRESAPGIEFLSLLKGGPEAEKGLDKMLDLITFPYAAVDSPSGRESVFLPLVLEIMQQHVLSSIATDLVAYSSLSAYSNNINDIKGKTVVFAGEDISSEAMKVEGSCFKENIVVTDVDTADEYVMDRRPDTVVGYTVCREDPEPGTFCYKILIDTGTGELCYFRKHRITKRVGPGFLMEDIKRISEAVN